FEVIAYAGANSSVSNSQSFATLSAPLACELTQLTVTGATSLSTTGTILASGNKMSEDLALSLTTTGACSDAYEVKAVDPSNAGDLGSPYVLAASAGNYTATVSSSGAHGWATGVHTFTVWDVTTNAATPVVKTFKVCTHGSASC
ncbi:MAG TPA: hypothetical protein VK771_06420, partial [Acidimicrobiia bacterium]|nr:hypothetical protein [Acidimicrobiia bacterium]